MKYIKSLDSIRAIAIILVLMTHWLPYKFIQELRTGGIGVDTFFVLSGFLITRILLENRKEAEINGINKLKTIKNFIFRRALRIFPAYYLTLTFIYIFNTLHDSSVNHNYSYSMFYISNIQFFLHQTWDGLLSHLWSLSVEEQFYILWPWLMIFTPQKHLPKIILIAFGLGLFSNYLFYILFPGTILLDILTPTCFDAFSIGALFSYITVYKADNIKIFSKYLALLALFCMIVFIDCTIVKIDIIPKRTLISVCALYLIVFAVKNQSSILHKFILNNSILVFIGKISYGIYLYHSFMPWIWNSLIKFLNRINIAIPLLNTNIPVKFANEIIFMEQFILVTIIAWLSWKFFENPICKLKRKYEYKTQSTILKESYLF